MRTLAPISILCVGSTPAVNLDDFVRHLRAMFHVRVTEAVELPGSLPDVHMVITIGMDHLSYRAVELSNFVNSGGAWLHIVGCSETRLPEIFGAQPGPVGPVSELRVLFTERDNEMAERLSDAVYVPGTFQELRIDADDTETVLYADWRYSHRAMVVRRPFGQGHTACTTLQAFDHPEVQQIFYRLVRSLTGQPFGQSIGVGILGYAPSVGRLHGLGCRNTQGLELIAACDLSNERRHQAQLDFQNITLYGSGELMAEDPEVDLIIVATPPNTHADLSRRMM